MGIRRVRAFSEHPGLMDQGTHKRHGHEHLGAPGRRSPRLAIGGIFHETNTFSPVPTTLDAFRRRSYLVGDGILRHCRDARNALSGIVDAATAAGATLVPTLFASATPAGIVTRETFAQLREVMLGRLRTFRYGPWPLDGVILALHGAMVAEGEDDAEGALLQAVRDTVGSETTLIAVLDFHANVSQAMVEAADLLLGYDTYPHVDTYERGQEAVDRFYEIRAGRLRPVTALRVLPLLAPLPPQCTTAPTPMREVMALTQELEHRPDVVTATVAGGFPYSDIPGAGVSVQVVTDNDRPLAEALADRLAAAIWDRRNRFATRGYCPDDAIDRALAATGSSRPIVFADLGDNPGAGAPGDGTALLSRLIERQVAGAALAAITDPGAVAAATAAGVGATIHVSIGGKIDRRGGEPIDLPWRVQRLADGTFTNRGPMGMGGPTRLGRTAVLSANGVEVVVCERRVQALDPELFRSVGIEPAERRVLAVKSSVHFRAAFEPIAAAVIEVETPGLSASDLTAFPYRRVRRPIAPLDREVRYLD